LCGCVPLPTTPPPHTNTQTHTLSHTHTHIHTYTHCDTHTHTHTHTLGLSQTHTVARAPPWNSLVPRSRALPVRAAEGVTCVFVDSACVGTQTMMSRVFSPSPMRQHPGAAVRDAWVTRLNAHAVDSPLLVHLVHTSVLVLPWTQRLPPKTRLSSCVCACVKCEQTAFSCRRSVPSQRVRDAQHPCAITVRVSLVASDSSLPSLPPVIRLGTQRSTRVSRHQGEMPYTSPNSFIRPRAHVLCGHASPLSLPA
jgi:hypothetical protein